MTSWAGRPRRRGRRTIAVLAVGLACLFAPPAAEAAAPYTIVGAFPGGIAGLPDLDSVDQMAAWQRKRNGIVNVFSGDPVTAFTLSLVIWERYRAVPMISYQPLGLNALRAGGLADVEGLLLAVLLRLYVEGPDGVLDTGDDRRLYFRYGYEVNHDSHAYSPCNPLERLLPGSDQAFAESWRRTHRALASAGLHRRHVAWVFSVAAFDTCPEGAPERTYPGHQYVDWLGIDIFSCGPSPGALLTPMLGRLRSLAPGKPVGTNEVGVTSRMGVAAKNAWIREYWDYLAANDLRMSLWINWDTEDGNTNCADGLDTWAVFGQTYGDETHTSGGRTFRAFSAYREAVGRSSVITTNPSNPRLLTDSQFLGQ